MRLSEYTMVLLAALLISTPAQAQTNANVLLRSVYVKVQKAKDYTAEANITVDMPFIHMLPINAKIYFKQKDKFKVESNSIAIVPRQGFDQASKILADTGSFTAIKQGDEKIGKIQTSLVNVIPMSDTSDIILGKFWIDAKQHVIIKSQLTTRSSGTVVTEYTYGKEVEYGLPDQMIFSVDVKKFKMPKGISSDLNKTDTVKETNANGNKKGKIIISLSNYQVNKGIPDSVFKK